MLERVSFMMVEFFQWLYEESDSPPALRQQQTASDSPQDEVTYRLISSYAQNQSPATLPQGFFTFGLDTTPHNPHPLHPIQSLHYERERFPLPPLRGLCSERPRS